MDKTPGLRYKAGKERENESCHDGNEEIVHYHGYHNHGHYSKEDHRIEFPRLVDPEIFRAEYRTHKIQLKPCCEGGEDTGNKDNEQRPAVPGRFTCQFLEERIRINDKCADPFNYGYFGCYDTTPDRKIYGEETGTGVSGVS
jgi:hypothetical protein